MGHRRRRLSVCATSVAILVSLVPAVPSVFTPNPAFAASATLLWTAPGDDGSVGRASQYALRISTNAISAKDTLSWWNAATSLSMAGKIPAVAGTLDSTVVSGLTSGTRYYAIIRAADEVPNWSGFSNVAAIDAALVAAVTVTGTVRESSTGIAIGGAAVHESGSGVIVYTQPDGTYSLSVPAGTLSITASKYGYSPVTSSVAAASASSKTLDFTLPKIPTGTLSGVVFRANDGTFVSGAEITSPGTPLQGVTGSDGKFALVVPQSTVTLRCDRPGFKLFTRSVTITAGKAQVVNFSLTPAVYYDDAETDMGWSLSAVGDDAVTGKWVRAAPVGTIAGTVEVQPSKDHTPGAGTACFVTGNGTKATDLGEADVDGGRTTLTSPALRLAGIVDPRIVYWRWFSNDASSNPGEDAFLTQISNNGGAWVTVSNLYTTRNYWERMEIAVKSYFSQPGNVQVRFIAKDLGNTSIVEAAIDDLMYYSGTTVTAVYEEEGAPSPGLVIGAPRPSPTRGPTEISLELPKAAEIVADIFNVQGRLVRTLGRRTLPAGRHMLRWDGRLDAGGNAASGVYWLKVGAGDVEKRFKLVVVR
ncbi:MAG: hypothetical protein E6K76_11280 [Candidatus Eisenbacteria bacterium]|uniref:FlgD/Vpr Ig-like domain-containing protein n=1 Tax=Eiseniibacteriota bacterium TaxID=2212470 RepID=A0A538T0N4_UNCEI|nr:MAG: hypothetical protein E6K76_11280 [Candidatus Eisenbacteria bacterium]